MNQSSPLPPSNGYRVLIVEDNPHITEMYTYALRKLAAKELNGSAPFEVHFAADGHRALQILREAPEAHGFSLVLTDLYMPVMDGFELVQQIRQEAHLAHIPVVAISGGGADAQARAQQVGVTEYLRKPVQFVAVLATVKRLLGLGAAPKSVT